MVRRRTSLLWALMVLLCLVLLCSMEGTRVRAAEPPVPLKIAILDVDRVLRSAAAVNDIHDNMRQYRDAYRNEIQQEEDAIRAAHQALGDARKELSQGDYDEQQRVLNERVSRAQAMMQERRRMLDEARAKAMNEVQAVLNTIVAEIATEQNVTLILRKDQTVLVATQFEITDEVLRRLDARLPTVQVQSLELK
ncbi:MAG: OmpH family outer membrane protein [Rhodospirillales bacterium]|nr:OmpH family outer membrane protein [Rhodospirillales bacterium]